MKPYLAVAVITVFFLVSSAAQVEEGGAVSYCGCAVMKGVPYVAEFVTESDRSLTDGNRIHKELHGTSMRDSQGRIREASESAMGSSATDRNVHQITISDSASQTVIILEPETKTAFVRHVRRRDPEKAAAIAKGSGADSRSRTTEALGTKEMEGLQVTGSRVTSTIAAGAIGNEKPIVSTQETWYSKELGITVLSISIDPQLGTVTRRLQNIRRIEPDPALYEVPPGYTVKEET